MSPGRRHVSRNLLLAILIGGALMACGQRGPLVLPEEARPIERIEVPQPPPPAPQNQDDEQQKNER